MNSKTIKYWTPEQTQKFFKAIEDKRDYVMLRIAYHHGLRASELGKLERDDFRPEQKRLFIRRGKGSVSSDYRMDDDDVRLLKAYLKARPDPNIALFLSRKGNAVSRQQVYELVNHYGTAAKLPEDLRHPHCLKHSIAVHLLLAEADIKFIQEWLGHKRIESTLVYAELLNPERDRRARKHFMKLPKI